MARVWMQEHWGMRWPEDVAAAVAEWFGSERRATLVYRKASA